MDKPWRTAMWMHPTAPVVTANTISRGIWTLNRKFHPNIFPRRVANATARWALPPNTESRPTERRLLRNHFMASRTRWTIAPLPTALPATAFTTYAHTPTQDRPSMPATSLQPVESPSAIPKPPPSLPQEKYTSIRQRKRPDWFTTSRNSLRSLQSPLLPDYSFLLSSILPGGPNHRGPKVDASCLIIRSKNRQSDGNW